MLISLWEELLLLRRDFSSALNQIFCCFNFEWVEGSIIFQLFESMLIQLHIQLLIKWALFHFRIIHLRIAWIFPLCVSGCYSFSIVLLSWTNIMRQSAMLYFQTLKIRWLKLCVCCSITDNVITAPKIGCDSRSIMLKTWLCHPLVSFSIQSNDKV